LNLRVAIGKRVGVASSNRLDEDGLRRVAETAVAIARNSAELEDWAGLPSRRRSGTAGRLGEPARRTRRRSCGPRASGPSSPRRTRRGPAVRVVLDVAEHLAIANSHGIRASASGRRAQLLSVMMAADGGSGYAEQAGVDVASIDARDGRPRGGRQGPRDGEPGRGRPGRLDGRPRGVRRRRHPVDARLHGLQRPRVQEERSFAEPGKAIGSELVTIVDDASEPEAMPMAFDYEGVAKQRVVLVERGVCRDVVWDHQTAARAGRQSTGHGLPAPNPYGPFPLNLVMSPGSTGRDELVGGMERGLLITRFHYTNPVHPKLAIVTGMTRDGTFLVEGGRIVGPVRNLRFTQSYLEALAGTVAVGRERRTIRGDFGGVLVPPIRVEGWTFTGATEH
jgi:hypothetical protein